MNQFNVYIYRQILPSNTLWFHHRQFACIENPRHIDCFIPLDTKTSISTDLTKQILSTRSSPHNVSKYVHSRCALPRWHNSPNHRSSVPTAQRRHRHLHFRQLRAHQLLSHTLLHPGTLWHHKNAVQRRSQADCCQWMGSVGHLSLWFHDWRAICDCLSRQLCPFWSLCHGHSAAQLPGICN